MPASLRLLLIVLVVAAVAYGAVGTWTVIQHASAAQDVVSTSEPLSLSAQRMYQALSDADVTATTSFLIGPNVRLPARQRYAADIHQAAAELTSLENATTTSANPQLVHSLAAVAAGLPVYTGYVSQAQTQFLLGYRLTAGSLMQVASEEMHLTLLPAARASYAQENAALTAASAQATGLPWIVVVLILAIALAFVLYRAQRWLSRSTHRVFNIGMLAATVALAVSAVWLLGSFAVAAPTCSVPSGMAPCRPRPLPRRPSTPSRRAATRYSISSRAAGTPRSSRTSRPSAPGWGPGRARCWPPPPARRAVPVRTGPRRQGATCGPGTR